MIATSVTTRPAPPQDPEGEFPVPFRSILFPHLADTGSIDAEPAPEIFGDLNIDQIVDSVVAGRDQHELRPFFHVPLHDARDVVYRQEVFADLATTETSDALRAFASAMHTVRERTELVERLRYRYERERWFLNAVGRYCSAVAQLAADLPGLPLRSDALIGLRDWVRSYVDSRNFQKLAGLTRQLLKDLDGVRYDLLIRGAKLTVGAFDDEADYSKQVLTTFDRFRQGDVEDHRSKLPAYNGMDHVEAEVLELVAQLQPDLFTGLDTFFTHEHDFLNDVVARFDREVQFYLAWLDYLRPVQAAGLPVCRPTVSRESKDIRADDTFDLALAAKLVRADSPVVRNDFHLSGPERVLVVSGPNQGGKTTLARTFGQLHYLASLGCLVAGTAVEVFLPERIDTHFEREENLDTLSGKLEDELNRIHRILSAATPDSVLILNEMFTSTTLHDALTLSTDILNRVTELDALCVCVTFIDELSTLNEKTVSMVSTVEPDDPAVRTFTLIRRPADGRAYARAIAEKYHLTYEALKGRIRP